MPKYWSLLFPIFLLSCISQEQPGSALLLENELLVRQFHFNREHAGPIHVSILAKSSGHTLAETRKAPYFELVVNQTLVTANDPVWRFQSESTSAMGNGGVEHQLHFTGDAGQVKGLKLTLYQQIFPNSPIVREKLELTTTGDQSFTLNKKDDRLHFKFPQYNLQMDNAIQSTEIRLASWNRKPITFARTTDPPGKSNHMYYPDIRTTQLDEGWQSTVKGPIRIVSSAQFSWVMTYEHASQDDLNGLLDQSKVKAGGAIVDAMQGTKGIFNFPVTEEDFKFLGIGCVRNGKTTNTAVEALRGAYLDGEVIDAAHPYASVWTAHFFHPGPNLEDSKALIRDYLLNKICEKPSSRQPEFYYNTWGLERARKEWRDVMTYENIFREIDHAAQLGMDIFVLDDGWEERSGDWIPHPTRLPAGLAPIKAKLDEYHMKMGIWLSPMSIDTNSTRYHQYPQWVIKDSEGNPVQGQWGHPVFDFVSGFKDLFVTDCKRLIDQGTRFFKWDAVNTFYSTLPNLHHGSDQYSSEELRARYEYLLPIYVVKAMEELTDYHPEVIIEIDLTEARRVMTGLAPLSQGKLFWMNNGASGYGDYGPYRTQSMRTIPNEYAGLIPLELFTYADYPHNQAGSLDYNVNTSLVAGHGFWGDLSLMEETDRLRVGAIVAKAKKVLPYLIENKPVVEGKVGDSPEIYSQINTNAGAGQVIAFSTKAIGPLTHRVAIPSAKVLAVLNAPYHLSGDSLTLHFSFDAPYTTQEAFILPLESNGIHITQSTGALDQVQLNENGLTYVAYAPGQQRIWWPAEKGVPAVESKMEVKRQVESVDQGFWVVIEVTNSGSLVTLYSKY